MSKSTNKTRKRHQPDGQVFLAKLGTAPTFALKEVAAALYVTNRGTQAQLLKLLRSGDLIASVCWPDPMVPIALPQQLWIGTTVEDFYVRERGLRGWDTADFVLGRSRLHRHLVVPRLKGFRSTFSAESRDGERVDPTKTVPYRTTDVGELDFAIRALEVGRAEAEVFVAASDARAFARRYFGSVETRGRGAPKTDNINAGLLEAFRRLHTASMPVKQDALVVGLLEWWNSHFEKRSETWVRDNIVRPVWNALKPSSES